MTDTPRFNWRCALGFHPWSKWSEAAHYVVTVQMQNLGGVWVDLPNPHDVSRWRQDRICAGCGETQRRQVGHD